MKKESMIKVLRYKAEHIKTKIRPEFFAEVADLLEQEPCCKCIEFKRYVKEMGFEIEQEPRWIPVSEKLPEEGKEVLVSAYDTYNKKVIVARYQGELYGFTCGLVSAWMPLPEPYKGESEGTDADSN